MPVLIFFSVILLSLVMPGLAVNPDDMARELQPIMDALGRKNTLKYLDSCDHSVELEKQKQEKALMNMITSLSIRDGIDEEKLKNDLIRISNSIARLPGHFCNGYANLQCNSSGHCDCAAIDESYGFKMSFKRDGDACLIVRGSLCAPQEVIEQSRKQMPLLTNVPSQEFRCADQSDCVVKSNGLTCTLDSMKAEFERFLKAEKNTISDPIQFIIRKTKEGVCVCKGISILASASLVVLSAIIVFGKSFTF